MAVGFLECFGADLVFPPVLFRCRFIPFLLREATYRPPLGLTHSPPNPLGGTRSNSPQNWEVEGANRRIFRKSCPLNNGGASSRYLSEDTTRMASSIEVSASRSSVLSVSASVSISLACWRRAVRCLLMLVMRFKVVRIRAI